jgi:hypothetical protein
VNLKSAFSTAIGAARFFFRSPQDVATENLAASLVKLAGAVLELPETADTEEKLEAFLKAYGWGVERDSTSGHISAVQQPAGRWDYTQGGHLQWIPEKST